MMTKDRRFAAVAVILMLLALLSTGMYYSSNKSLTNSLNNEKLRNERLLSESLSLQKDIENFRSQIESVTARNSDLDRVLAASIQQLKSKEAEFKKITLAGSNVTVLKKQVAELTLLRNNFTSRIEALNETIAAQKKERESIGLTVNQLDTENKKLWQENKQLALNLDIISSLTADAYLVESVKRKNIPTVMAKKARRISMSFKVPEALAENITFTVTKPGGAQIKGSDKAFSYRVIDDKESFLASRTKAGFGAAKKIEMTYDPREVLRPGIYKIEVYNGDKYVGSCNIKLR